MKTLKDCLFEGGVNGRGFMYGKSDGERYKIDDITQNPLFSGMSITYESGKSAQGIPLHNHLDDLEAPSFEDEETKAVEIRHQE